MPVDSEPPDQTELTEEEFYKGMEQFFGSGGWNYWRRWPDILITGDSDQQGKSFVEEESDIDRLKREYPLGLREPTNDSLIVLNFFLHLLQHVEAPTKFDAHLPPGCISEQELDRVNDAIQRRYAEVSENTLPASSEEIREMLPEKQEEYFRYLHQRGVSQSARGNLSQVMFKTGVIYVEAWGKDSNSQAYRVSPDTEERGRVTLTSEVLIWKYNTIKKLIAHTAFGTSLQDSDVLDLALTWLSAHEFTHMLQGAIGRKEFFNKCQINGIGVDVFPNDSFSFYELEDERQAEGFGIDAVNMHLRELLTHNGFLDVSSPDIEFFIEQLYNIRSEYRASYFAMAELVRDKQVRSNQLNTALQSYIRDMFGGNYNEKHARYKPLIDWLFNKNVASNLGRTLPYKQGEIVKIVGMINTS